MARSAMSLLLRLRIVHSYNSDKHVVLNNLLNSLDPESLPEYPRKIAIDMATFEEIATLTTYLSQQDSNFLPILDDFEKIIKNTANLRTTASLLRKDVVAIKQTIDQESKRMKSQIKQISSILKQYRDRCRDTFLDYLKGIDLDLRKVLKPLVPTHVLNEQVKFPMINNNPSLRSSLAPSREGTGNIESYQNPPENELEIISQPDPAELTNEKLNSHIQMLVGTLEGIAKDLIQVLAETDRQYYDLLNKVEVYSRPPTPLAAPLPEYFIFENIDASREDLKIINVPKRSKAKWKKRLTLMYEQGGIEAWVYQKLLKRINKFGDHEIQVDLNDIFRDIDIPMSFRENIAFALVNTSKIPQKDVSLSEILGEELKEEKKPEPPKEPKTKSRPFAHKFEKEGLDITVDERLEMINNTPAVTSGMFQHDIEMHRASPVPRMYQSRNSVPSHKMIGKKPMPPTKEQGFKAKKERKDIRVRSITPVGKLKEKTTPRRKTRTPVGMKSINLNNYSAYNYTGL